MARRRSWRKRIETETRNQIWIDESNKSIFCHKSKLWAKLSWWTWECLSLNNKNWVPAQRCASLILRNSFIMLVNVENCCAKQRNIHISRIGVDASRRNDYISLFFLLFASLFRSVLEIRTKWKIARSQILNSPGSLSALDENSTHKPVS